MHWVDQVAEILLKRGREHVIASGTSISGHIHIGHSNDVFIADAIRRAVEERGGKAQAIWYADDFDPLRRIPAGLPEKYREYLGVPYANLPSPVPGFSNFVEYYTRPFLDSLKTFGIKVKVYFGSEVYRSGKLKNQIKLALEKAEVVRQILNRFRARPLPSEWLPYNPICSKCGRISTTQAYDWQGEWVYYRCVGCDYVKGCGNEDQANYAKGEGKLTWRVEWPARWSLLGVTCEPFGKDHAEAGGSYDTGKLIVKEVFGTEPPHPIPYEWISLAGQRMSSSKGIVFTLSDWLEVAEPELLRFFIFRSKPMKSKNFEPRGYLLNLYDEFDELERRYFSGEAGEQARIYELSMPEKVPESRPQRVPFRFAVILCQVVKEFDMQKRILFSRGILKEPSELDLKLARRRLTLALHWVQKYAVERYRIEIQSQLPPSARELTLVEKECLRALAEKIGAREMSPEEIHNSIYEVARSASLEPPALFQAIYLCFLGKREGPRAGNLLAALDREFVVKRLLEASET